MKRSSLLWKLIHTPSFYQEEGEKKEGEGETTKDGTEKKEEGKEEKKENNTTDTKVHPNIFPIIP